MEEFYVYNNWRRDRGRIHRAECPFCNRGKGMIGSRASGSDEFRGPFQREEAFAVAASLGRKEMAPCGKCLP